MSANRNKSRKIESNHSKYSQHKEYMTKVSKELKEYMKMKEDIKNNYEKHKTIEQRPISTFRFESTEFIPYYREDIHIPDPVILKDSLDNLQEELKKNPDMIFKIVSPPIVSPTPELLNSIAYPTFNPPVKNLTKKGSRSRNRSSKSMAK
jgi:hypothetical protein